MFRTPFLLLAGWLAVALASQVKKDDPVVMHRKARHGGQHRAQHPHQPPASRELPAASQPPAGLSGMELLQQLAGHAEGGESPVPPPAVREEAEVEDVPAPVPRRLGSRKQRSPKARLQLLQALHQRRTKRQLRSGSHRRLQRRLRRGAAAATGGLRRGNLRHGHRLALGTTAYAASVDAEEAALKNATDQRQFTIVQAATVEVNKALHNNEQERDMLQTQMLSSGQSMFVLKKLAMTVAKMKSQIEVLEQHEKICRKRVADFKSGQYQQAEDARLANSVQVVG